MGLFGRRKVDEEQVLIEETARRLVATVRQMAYTREKVVPATLADFPGYDAAFYDTVGRELQTSGFRPLGEFAVAGVDNQQPAKRSFYQMGLSDDGTALAAWFVVPADDRGPLRCTVFTTWLEDGRVCETNRGTTGPGVPLPPEHLVTNVGAEATTVDLLRMHREAVAAANGTPQHLADTEEVLAARDAQQRQIAEFRTREGLALFEPMLRNMLGDEFEERGRPILTAIQRHPEWWDQPLQSSMKRENGMPTIHANQLAIPPEVVSDADAFELARVWSGSEHQFYVLNVERYPEPAVWGMMALDLMKHAARAYELLGSGSREDVYKRILTGFMAEMQNPTEPL